MSEIEDRRELETLLLAQRPWFERWRPSKKFRVQIVAVDQAIRSEFLFRLPSANWVQEALTLSLFAVALDAAGVRLNRNDPPDAFLRLDGVELPIEIAKVLDPNRKRSDEYHPDASTLSHVEMVDKEQEAVRAEGQLATMLERKRKNQSAILPSLCCSCT